MRRSYTSFPSSRRIIFDMRLRCDIVRKTWRQRWFDYCLFSPWKKKNINATHYILSTYTHAMYFFNHQRLPVGNGEEGRGGKKGSVAGRCCQVGNVNYRISRRIIIHRITGQCLRLLFPAVFFATPHLSPWTLIFPCLFFFCFPSFPIFSLPWL